MIVSRSLPRASEVGRRPQLLFSQRLILSRVKSPMQWCGRHFLWRKIGVANVLSGSSLLMTILMVVAFFVGCETSKPASQADSNSVIREPDKGHEIHGEVGAMYGTGLS